MCLILNDVKKYYCNNKSNNTNDDDDDDDDDDDGDNYNSNNYFKFIINIDFYCSSFLGSHQISRFWSLHRPQESTQNRILQRNIT